jgi:hypothetical protein
MFNIDGEKDRLSQKLSEQYSQNVITIEEYERLLEYINKIETGKEISIIEKIIERIIQEDSTRSNELAQNNEITIPKTREKHLSMFAWRTANIKPVNGNAGKFTSVFGANRIIIDILPVGRTVLNVNAIFGLVEIVVPKNIKITNKAAPMFAGIFTPNEINKRDKDLPELYIIGKAIFGNITVKTTEEFEEELRKEKEFGKKVEEKIRQKIYDKM